MSSFNDVIRPKNFWVCPSMRRHIVDNVGFGGFHTDILCKRMQLDDKPVLCSVDVCPKINLSKERSVKEVSAIRVKD